MAARNKPSVFLDSNVFYSGLHSPSGTYGKILNFFTSGQIDVIISQLVLEEMTRTIKIKMPEKLAIFRTLLITSQPTVVKNPTLKEFEYWSKIIDVEDAPILASAVLTQPDYLITGDKHFFEKKVSEKSGLRIVTPAQFVKEFEKTQR